MEIDFDLLDILVFGDESIKLIKNIFIVSFMLPGNFNNRFF